MCILGVGVDLVKISRIKTALERHGARRFMQRILTKSEMEYALSTHGEDSLTLAPHVAGRFAGKEAIFKCICPLERRLGWREFSIFSAEKIGLQVSGNLPHDIRVHVSISHDGDYAMATAIVSRAL